MSAKLENNHGLALVMVLMVMTILLALTGSTILFSGLGIKAASNHKTGSAAFHAAEAGVQHTVALIPSGSDFNSLLQGSVTGFSCLDVNGSAAACDGVNGFPTVTGSLNGYTYTVVVTNDTTVPGETAMNDINRVVILTATAKDSNGTARRVRAFIGRQTGTWQPPATVYLPGASTSAVDFDPSSTTFTIDGNDTNHDNTAGSQPTVTGIDSNNAAIANDIATNDLNTAAKKRRVKGKGFVDNGTTVTPSVSTTATIDSVSSMATNFANQVPVTDPCPPKCPSGLVWDNGACPTAAACTLGTNASPAILHLGGSSTSILGGNAQITGVVVAEGKVKFQDNVVCNCLVLNTQVAGVGALEREFKVFNNAVIRGGVLVGPNNEELEFEIDDSAAVSYSSQTISLVQTNWGTLLPQPPKVIAIVELMQ